MRLPMSPIPHCYECLAMQDLITAISKMTPKTIDDVIDDAHASSPTRMRLAGRQKGKKRSLEVLCGGVVFPWKTNMWFQWFQRSLILWVWSPYCPPMCNPGPLSLTIWLFMFVSLFFAKFSVHYYLVHCHYWPSFPFTITFTIFFCQVFRSLFFSLICSLAKLSVHYFFHYFVHYFFLPSFPFTIFSLILEVKFSEI